ncbi:MAG: DUF554 domain-containing protein [Ruminococcaceae bacterium]|nr:DUF554 domain-containing protein [Oscillospiraceae bacterium]
MGILLDGLSVAVGAILGKICKKRIMLKNFSVLGIGIMIISLVGFFENVFNIKDMKLESSHLLLVILALIIGSWIGEAIGIEEKLSLFAKYDNIPGNAFMDATLFFGIGGLQISGPILLALNQDNSQLILKSLIDFPFALMFGMSYGGTAAFSAIPVMLLQLLFWVLACLFGNFFSDGFIGQLCAMGYIVLFFSGFNLICDGRYKISNVNMIPGIFLIIVFNLLWTIWGIAV